MKKILLAGIAAIAIAGSTMVYAQHRQWFHEYARMNPEDRAAFVDARIAAVKAGLKLTPDQEKLWPPVEAAVRDFAKLRIDRANAMAASAAAMRRIADVADPLYKTLDEGQRRRLAILTQRDGRFGGGGGWGHRGFDRGDGDRGDGRGRDGGPERL